MIHLGSIPIILDIFVVVVVLLRLFAWTDHVVDWLGARLLHQGRSGGRASRGFLLFPSGARPPHCIFARGGHQRKRS